MKDSTHNPETTAELASELDRQQAQNGKILHHDVRRCAGRRSDQDQGGVT